MICLWGLGRVGRALLSLVDQRQAQLESSLGMRLRVGGVADSRVAVLVRDDAELKEVIRQKAGEGRISVANPVVYPSQDWISWLKATRAKVLIDSSVSDFQTGRPALDIYRVALRQGMDIITANKAPLVHGLKELRSESENGQRQFRYGATVGAALPAWEMLNIITREGPVARVEGVLNGTTNWILTEMEEKGISYSSALAEAQARGYAEPDPQRDVEGTDTAAKLLILANSFWQESFSWKDLGIGGITQVNVDMLEEARRQGGAIKLLGRIERDRSGRWKLSVGPEQLPGGHPLAGLKGTQKGLSIETTARGSYALLGGSSGAEPTAAAMYRELLDILQSRTRLGGLGTGFLTPDT